MGGKHFKRLRAENSKIHFKKRVLSKGQNLTNTTFTVKKIITAEQLRKIENEPVSSWNIPLKDLLIRLNHYNVTSRVNGLFGIKELLTKHPEILKGSSLRFLMSKLLELLTDEESKVRVTTVDLLTYLFDLIPSASVTLFHDILNVHLCCAMTHRNTSVQQDSLKLIDIMIKYTPEAIRHNFKAITENFLRIIKNDLCESHIGRFTESGFKHHLGKTKTNILLRFYNLLVVGCSDNKNKNSSDHKSTVHNVNILNKHKTTLRNASDQYKNIPDLSSLFKCSEEEDKILTDFDVDEFQVLCSLIIPMLFDTWVEFSPSQIVFECVLTKEIGDLLLVLLKILLVLYLKAVAFEDAKMEYWFASNYGPAFQNFFTSNFPYLPSVSMKESKASNNSEFSTRHNNFIIQNLLICHLSYLFKVVTKNSDIETKMENYISDTLMMTSSTETEILSQVVEAILSASDEEKSNIIFNNVLEAYNATKNLELRRNLSKILARVVLKENEFICLQNECIMNWIKSLPYGLCESQIFVQEIETLLKLINKPIGIDVLREVEQNAEKIMINLAVIRIHGVLQLEGQKMIANILYRCRDKVLKGIIEKNLHSVLYPEDLRNYVRDIFSQKLGIYCEFL